MSVKLNPSAITIPSTKVREDSVVSVPFEDPGKKKLRTPESQRILAVIDETIGKLELVMCFSYIIDNISEFREFFDVKLITQLEHHKTAQDLFQDAIKAAKKYGEIKKRQSRRESDSEYSEEESLPPHSPSSSISSLSSIIPENEQIEEVLLRKVYQIPELKRQLSDSCKNVLRLFRDNRAAAEATTPALAHRTQRSLELIQHFKQLREDLLERLLVSPTEENRKVDLMYKLTKRIKKQEEIISRLEDELHTANYDREAEVKKRQYLINQLQTKLGLLKKAAEDEIRRSRAEATGHVIKDKRESEAKQEQLRKEKQLLLQQFEKMKMEHNESESVLRKKRFKIETELENWLQKYDQDMGERQERYEDIEADYNQVCEELTELEQRFKEQEPKYSAIMEEHQLAKEKREQEERELQIKIKASTIIQSFWRSYKCRKMLRSKSRKQRGKKGGRRSKNSGRLSKQRKTPGSGRQSGQAKSPSSGRQSKQTKPAKRK